ncbi:hypothetical protein N7530_011454 [Penicillium desertorum]|uniref:Uncharacterized protein n=1 Tax=Penicillium desertorum TaxID=1303715 RepID=A0A9X0BFQ1_9EURO|nr:hypothetical protein N7530_011454 [Penicillium desertorum]
MEIYLRTFDLSSERQNPRQELTESRQEPSREGTIHDRHKRAAKVKAIHQRFLGVFGIAPHDYKLQKGSPAPDIVLIKEFIFWYTLSTRGRLRPDGRPTVITTLACAERFFNGFEAATGNMVAEEDRLETYRFFYEGY